MTSTDPRAYHDNRVTLGCFEVAGSVCAIDVTQLREVVRWRELTPLPKAPDLLEGVVDLRGTVLPVVDLGRALSRKKVEATADARIVVVEVEGLVLGLAVDAAIEVLSVDVSSLEDPPALATQAGYDATRAVVCRPDATPILVLSLEHVLEAVYRSGLRGSEEAA